MTTDEAESLQKKPRQQEETGQNPEPPSPEEEQLRPRNRNSAGRGLSRLFSSFLKRRSQCDSEAGEKEDNEEEAKAPIADPEPELRTEGEVALDQHSVSSAEAQVSRHAVLSLSTAHLKPPSDIAEAVEAMVLCQTFTLMLLMSSLRKRQRELKRNKQ